MKKIFYALFALALAVSCEEFEPVFTFKYDEPAPFVGATDAEALAAFGATSFTTIAELKSRYKVHEKPVKIEEPLVIRGEVTTSDESGNVYREIYLQDASGAIDFKRQLRRRRPRPARRRPRPEGQRQGRMGQCRRLRSLVHRPPVHHRQACEEGPHPAGG